MRITFASVEDFCAELQHVTILPASVWRNEVRFRIDADAEQKEEISFRIGLWLTALADTPDGQYVLEYADLCGVDDPDEKHHGRPVDAGTREALRRVHEVELVAKSCGLTMRPGKIETI